MIRLDRLRAFLAFADTLSFTRAAEVLHLSQPALHVQIGKLGEELGVDLYRRVGRRLELTVEGERLAAFARELQERTEGFMARLHGRADTTPVSLCAGEGSLRYLLADALQAWLAESEGVRLRVFVGDAAHTATWVASGRAQLGVTVPGTVGDDLRAEPLVDVRPMLVCPASDPLAERSRVRAADLAGRRLVVPPPGRPHRQRLDRFLSGVSWQVAAEVQGWDLLVQLVRLGLGVAVVNEFVETPAPLAAVPVEGLQAVGYALLTRRHAPLSSAARRLADEIRRACAGETA
ncbi:MAG: LysR family transcriptional regulator [Myxococcales bacterium]|nr:LysR family transcriptional regulator [Myxococcales bacterium]